MKTFRVGSTSIAFLAAVVFTSSSAPAQAAGTSTNKSATTAAAVTAAADATNDVVARVNGKTISRKELDTATQAFSMQLARRGQPVPASQLALLQHDMLEELIGRELLLQEGVKHQPADLDKKVQEQVDQTRTQLGGEEEFKKTLAENGIAPEEYTKRVRDNLVIRNAVEQAVEKSVAVTPEEVRAYYDKNPDQFKEPEMVRASHILIRCPLSASDEVKKEKRAQIEAARVLIKGGEKFADVAKKVSEDPGSGQNGGDLGYFRHGQMVPEFDAAAFSLKTNELSDVITTQFGYHILMVTGHKAAQTMAFADVKDELTQYLKQRKSSEVTRDHVDKLRKEAKVDVLLPEPPGAAKLPPPTATTPSN